MEIRQGVDISSVKRMKEAIERRGERFIRRVFTGGERDYCESKRMRYEHYAARFAAKEAVMKAIGIKKKDRFRFREIEIRRQPTGKPFVHMSDETCKRFGLSGEYQIEISMAHEREYAVASALIVLP